MNPQFPTEEPSNARFCPQCGQRVPRTYRGDTCPACEEEALYQQVKAYIETHNATATQVAQEFHIPLAQVKDWIENGYFVYRNTPWH
ncbi:MAG: hydrogenase maturation nickel metallochaperone HypA [Lachnospiraceae bacterium]|nr:hydrogenase maturation nickel metallochaperone HypA [Lachnospiraceae bacterium]